MNGDGVKFQLSQNQFENVGQVEVWDLPVRLFHWMLVASVGVAAFTGYLLPANWLQVHLVSGTFIAALVGLSGAMGFHGTWFSRFRSFVFSPTATLHMSGSWFAAWENARQAIIRLAHSWCLRY